MIRLWRGWTTPGNAVQFETLLMQKLLKGKVFVGLQNRRIPGIKSIHLLRRDSGGQVEFVTSMLFDSLDAVHEFAGQNQEAAVVTDQEQAFLLRFDERAHYYEIRGVHLNVMPRAR
jgi:hypothetical protein